MHRSNGLSARLYFLRATSAGAVLGLDLENETSSNLWVPPPDLMKLEVKDAETGVRGEWFTDRLSCFPATGFVLAARATLRTELEIAFVRSPSGTETGWPQPWRLECTGKAFHARLRLGQAAGYAHPESLHEFSGVVEEARGAGAEPWFGEVLSNTVAFGMVPGPS